MTNYIEQINKLAAVVGCPVNFIDQVPVKTLKDELAQLTSFNAAKRRAIDSINDEIDKMKALITSLKDEELCSEKEMEGNYQRTNILKQYMETIESSETFLPNKVAREVEEHINSIYGSGMEIHERRAEVIKHLEVLRKLQNECDELRKEAGQ